MCPVHSHRAKKEKQFKLFFFRLSPVTLTADHGHQAMVERPFFLTTMVKLMMQTFLQKGKAQLALPCKV